MRAPTNSHRPTTPPPDDASLAHEPERALADPGEPGPFSWARAVERDEASLCPLDALDALVARGFGALYVPGSLGGAMPTLPALVALGRALARRDPAVALAGGVRAWGFGVWAAGSPRAASSVAGALLRGEALCFAASERRHGADLVASETTAVEAPGGFELSGEKWPVGQAPRASRVLVLARDAAMPAGPAGLSLFLVEREAHDAPRIRVDAPLPLDGMRGAEVAGVRFERARVGADALIGERGRGLEQTLLLFQLTRPLVCSIALGIADTALRLATAFARARVLRGRAVADLPWVRGRLAGAFADLLAAEALVDAAVRCAHVAPSQLATASLVAKVVVPDLTGRALDAAGEVLGARGYLRGGYASGVFQKLARDHRALAIFDGSTPVCLAALATQLPALLGPPDDAAVARERRGRRLAARFDPTLPLPGLDPRKLSLLARTDDVVAAADDEATVAAVGALRRDLAARSAMGAPLHVARRYADLHARLCLRHRAAFAPRPEAGALARLIERPHERDEGDLRAAFDALVSRVEAPSTLTWEPAPVPDSPLAID